MKLSKTFGALLTLAFALSGFSFAGATENGSSQTEQNNPVDPALVQKVEADETLVPPGNPVELKAGHIDLGPLLINGKWELYARDDTTATAQWRDPNEVVFRVSDATKQQIPANETYQFIKADVPVWVVPQQELQGAIWLGWNTQAPAVIEQVNGGVDLIFEGHQGPGDFHVFIQAGNFAGPQQLWNSTKKAAQPIHVELNTHTHVNWVFTQPGIHLVRVTAQAQLKNGQTVSQTKLLRFAVSDATDAEETLAAKWTSENDSANEVTQVQPNALDQNTAFPFIIGGVIFALVIVVLGAVFTLRKRNENAKAAGEDLAGTKDAAQQPQLDATES